MKIIKKLSVLLFAFAGLLSAQGTAQTMEDSVRARLYAQAAAGNLMELQRLQEIGYSLEMQDQHGNTPYCQAVWSQNELAVRTLAAAGADLNPKCLQHIPYVTMAAVYSAARSDDLQQLVRWKKEGLNIDVTDPKSGNTALCQAVYDGDCEAISTLLKAGASQGTPCMRSIPREVREDLDCRPMVINWRAIGYTTLGLGLAGVFVGVVGSDDNKGTPECGPNEYWSGETCIYCAPDSRWINETCVACDTCWKGEVCLSQTDYVEGGYYRDEVTYACWQVAPPPVEMTKAELDAAVALIEDEDAYKGGKFLTQINAAEAYARGYTGYMVRRDQPYGQLPDGAVSAGEKPKVSNEKIAVAIYSSGMNIGKQITATSPLETSTDEDGKVTTTGGKAEKLWDWTGVNQAFYDYKNEQVFDKYKEYTTTDVGAGSSVDSVPIGDRYVSAVKDIENNFVTKNGQPIGKNYDYGSCIANVRTTNCYGPGPEEVTLKDAEGKDVKYNYSGLTVFYESGFGATSAKYKFLKQDIKTGKIIGTTSVFPLTAEEGESYVSWQSVKDNLLNVEYIPNATKQVTETTADGQTIISDINYYEWNENDPSVHYQSEGFFDNDKDKGTLLAGIVAGMNNNDKMHGVAYNAAVLPVNRDLVSGLTDKAMAFMVANSDIILLDDNVRSSEAGVNDALGAFDESSGTYTVRKATDVLGWASSEAYQYAMQNKKVIVIGSGNEQELVDGKYKFNQPSLDAAIPFLDYTNIDWSNTEEPDVRTTWNSEEDALPTISTNPVQANNYFNNLFIVASSLNQSGTGLSSYAQPCGIAGQYCLVAPGGDRVTGSNLLSTASPGEFDALPTVETGGTSAAAAVVSGALAVVMGAYPHLTPQQATEILLKTATYIEPTADDIEKYDKIYYGGDEATGRYNSVYGHGLVNLAAATKPVGGKEGLWVYRTGSAIGGNDIVIKAASTRLLAPSALSARLTNLPTTMVAFDAYNRPFEVPTQGLFTAQKRRKAKTFEDFKAFMGNQDPIQVEANETFSMKYRMQSGNRVTLGLDLPMGLMEINLKHKKMRYGLFYTQDTTMGRGAYWKRRSANPFIQMKNAYGVETGYEMTSKWSIEAGWMSGENGFFDDERFFDAPENKMQAFTGSVVFKPNKQLSLKLGGGVMNESGSSLGMVSEGAFEIEGAKTQFLSAGISYQPTDKINLEATYSYGITRTASGAGLMNLSRLHSDSFALTASYQPDENALFGVSVSSPLRVRKGKMNISLPVGRHPTEDIFYYDTYQAEMKPEAREIDFSLYYQGDISDEFEVKSEIGVRLNPDHQADAAPDYRGMVGIKLKI